MPGPFLIIRKAILSLSIRGEHRGLGVEVVQHAHEEHHQKYKSHQYQNGSTQERQSHQKEAELSLFNNNKTKYFRLRQSDKVG